MTDPSSYAANGLFALTALTVALLGVVVARPALTRGRPGKVLAFLAFLVLPILVTWGGAEVHLEHAKTTTFCMSCHEMAPYGKSLGLADDEHLPAVHFQNNWVPREKACYTCHAEYTMFGGVRAKLKGLGHVTVHYLGTPPKPGEIKLYDPFRNRECFHCHAGARRYLEVEEHTEEAAALASNELSCLECHDVVHDAGDVDHLERWDGAAEVVK